MGGVDAAVFVGRISKLVAHRARSETIATSAWRDGNAQADYGHATRGVKTSQLHEDALRLLFSFSGMTIRSHQGDRSSEPDESMVECRLPASNIATNRGKEVRSRAVKIGHRRAAQLVWRWVRCLTEGEGYLNHWRAHRATQGLKFDEHKKGEQHGAIRIVCKRANPLS